MKKIVLLSTDTLHHRYFINKLREVGYIFYSIIYETTSITAPFKTGPFLDESEERYEQEHFFIHLSSDISSEDIIKVENINNQDALDHLARIQPDLGIVFGSRKLSKEVINSFHDGLYNIHRGISQKYRGLDSDLWTIYHGDLENIGVTLHKVELQLDTGQIVYQTRIQLPQNTKLFHLRYLTTKKATDLCIQALDDYFKGDVKLTPQNEKGRHYSFMPLCIKQTLIKKLDRLING